MYYNLKEDKIELSVRELCALTSLSGDLDTRHAPVSRFEAARVGREIHQRLQGEYGSAYHAEVTLRHECRMEEVTFLISGRADGVLIDDKSGDYIIEEIKTLSRPMGQGFDSFLRQEDMAQLICYGYFLALSKSLSQVILRLTYVHTSDGEIYYQDAHMPINQLREAFISMLNIVLPRARDLRNRDVIMRPAAKKARFPYPHLRPEQEDMIRECWRDMRHKETVVAQAPTGIGKTISTLYPAVRCLGEGRCDQIFYLTAKSATRREAVGAVEKMIATGVPLRALVLAAREPMCGNPSAKQAEGRLTRYCNPDLCPRAKGYYDRVETVIQELLETHTGVFTPAVIQVAAEKGGVCPYELSLDLSERCDIVICDYNYVFSPSVYLKRYFSEGIPHTKGHRYIFLVDEAHNLADRARDLYSATLSYRELTNYQDALHTFDEASLKMKKNLIFEDEDAPESRAATPALTMDDLLGDLRQEALLCRDNMTENSDGVRRGAELRREAPLLLMETVNVLCKKYDAWLRLHATHPMYNVVDQLASALRAFRTASAYYDRHYATLTEVDGEEIRVSLICLDPSAILKPLLQKAVSRVLFSATLTPQDYFADILGGGNECVCVSFESPFPSDHLCVAVADHISLRQENRQNALRQVISYIAATVSAKKGHYLVYFPSYDYMQQVQEAFAKKYPKVRLLVQKQGMTAAERDAFIAAFSANEEDAKLKVGFCVLGGSFSEGVDLPGNSLIGVIVLGVGIPGLSSLRNIMAEYYSENREGEGYAYAYTYPGMNRVLQAAGRVIRRPEDKGVVVLLDDRFAAPPYTRLYPSHWKNMTAVGDPMSLKEHLQRFWTRMDGEDHPPK